MANEPTVDPGPHAATCTLSNAIDDLEYKIENGRVRNPENERVKVQYYRTLGYLVSTSAQLLHDLELDEFEERLQALEEDEA
ncbi:hypothetical protein [Halalkalicoccus salilacus]|uniref:hypothetical protein n=1 Tax=Halalkalicoccus salilacus TaxID=3117459 RepID=UPI00300EDB15